MLTGCKSVEVNFFGLTKVKKEFKKKIISDKSKLFDFAALEVGGDQISGELIYENGIEANKPAKIFLFGPNGLLDTLQSNNLGLFQMKNIRSGLYELVVVADGYLSQQKYLNVKSDTENKKISINMQKTLSIYGYLYEEKGKSPIENAHIYLTSEKTKTSTLSAANGEFIFDNLQSDTYELFVFTEEGAKNEKRIIKLLPKQSHLSVNIYLQ
jgi:hypothetical protein